MTLSTKRITMSSMSYAAVQTISIVLQVQVVPRAGYFESINSDKLWKVAGKPRADDIKKNETMTEISVVKESKKDNATNCLVIQMTFTMHY